MTDDSDISLRPVVLGPGGGANPFASFGKGAGFGIKSRKPTTSVLASSADDTSAPKKDAGKRIKYTKEFLMQFMERYTKCPLEVQQLGLSGLTEIVISGETERDQQRQVLQKVAEDIDDRDWRTRDAPGPPAPERAPAQKQEKQEGQQRDGNWDTGKKETASDGGAKKSSGAASQPPAGQAPSAQPAAQSAAASEAKIVRAADVGLQAYKPGAQLSSEQRSVRTIKGILNKLTPEKFERLLQQLLEVITTADVLKQTISMVFENAVEQPTYCAMYADLCLHLSKELPSFPPPSGSDKVVSFRQILLNTCQDEFEGTEQAREALSKLTDQAAHDEAERNVKKRTMGNMRLISELYKQDMVKDWIMTTCMEDLLVAPKGKVPPEDNIEAACEMMTTAGVRLSKSERADTRKKLDEVMRTLERIGMDSKGVSARIRFVIRDVLDLKRSNWVPRREVFTAKKLDEVRAQAEAELGMISSSIAMALPMLPTQQAPARGPGAGLPGMGGASAGAGDIPLIPPLRGEGGGGEEWGLFPPLRSQQGAPGGSSGGGAKNSALLGDYKPQQQQAAAAAAAQPAQAPVQAPVQAPSAPAASKPAAPISEEREEVLKRKSEGLLNEFLSTLDKKEALACVKELEAPEWMPKLVEVALELALNNTKEKERQALSDLLLFLHAQGQVSSSALVAGLTTYTAQLEDLSMDFPVAPALLGGFVGAAVNAKALGVEVLPTLLEGDYGVEPKRDMTAAALLAVQAAQGAEALQAACVAAGLKASSFLTADPELDGPDAPSVEQWLADNKLSSVPL